MEKIKQKGESKSKFGSSKMIEKCQICGVDTEYKRVNEQCPVFECTKCEKTTILHIPAVNIKLNNASFIYKDRETMAGYISSLVEVSSEKMYDVLCSEDKCSQRAISLIRHMEGKANDIRKSNG